MTLWEAGDPQVEGGQDPIEATLTVAEFGAAVNRSLTRTFPGELWVRGEIRGLRRPNASGHQYFDLVEPGASPGDRPAAVLSVALFRGARARVDATLASAGSDTQLADGIEVRIRGKVDWWIPAGRLSLKMSAIDPTFTLGRLDEQRRQLLAALAAEGLLDRNAALAMPLLPLRVGLVTSAGSAAHADFIHELAHSGYAFDVVLADARVQGADSPRSIVAGLERVFAAGVDVVALVRGGGAKTDLIAFDHGDVARAIATAPVPVLTGIGHEIDESVADTVAHLASKTPTAAAAAIVGVVAAAEDALIERGRRAASLALRRLESVDHRLLSTSQRVARGARVAAARADASLAVAAERVVRTSDRRLHGASARVDSLHARLGPAANRSLGRAAARLDDREARLRALDPARSLARGWSFTRTADGRLLTDPSQLRPGDQLVTTLARGRVDSTVTAVELDGAASPEAFNDDETDTSR